MPVGVIGLGRLGSALVRGLSRGNWKEPVYGYNRTREKSLDLEAECAGFHACASPGEVFESCDPVFLWTKPQDAAGLMEADAALLKRREPFLVSSTVNVPLSRFVRRWAECLPNVNMAVGRGVTLIRYSEPLAETDRMLARSILSLVGTVYEVSAEDLPVYSALTSCGPALYATLLELYADLLSSHRGWDRDRCRRMVRETVSGTMLLQESDGIDASEVVRRVAHPGGPSEAGTDYLKTELPGIFEAMLGRMKKW